MLELTNVFDCFVAHSGRTEYQTSTLNRARRSVKFERKPSQRYSRRPTFERREREERMKRERESRRRETEKKRQPEREDTPRFVFEQLLLAWSVAVAVFMVLCSPSYSMYCCPCVFDLLLFRIFLAFCCATFPWSFGFAVLGIPGILLSLVFLVLCCFKHSDPLLSWVFLALFCPVPGILGPLWP